VVGSASAVITASAQAIMIYYVYIIRMSDNYIYTGITNNFQKRLSEHKDGLCKLTKNRGPIKSCYIEKYHTRIEAAKREKEIKGWNKSKKLNLFNK